MIQRSVPMVVILSLVTFGIFPLIWYWTNAMAMKEKGWNVLHPIMIIIPIANIIFIWQFSGGVEKATNSKFSQPVALLLLLLLGFIGMAVIQNAVNETSPSVTADPFGNR